MKQWQEIVTKQSLVCLPFNDNSNYNPNDPARDKLYKIRPVMEYLVYRFQTMYTPEKNLSIDEELLLFKGMYVFN